MPITPQHIYKPLTQAEFGPLSYDVFADVLAIRHELGRFFDEKHYKKALALRRPDVILEAPILVTHQSFKKFHFLDVLVILGCVFEFKVVEAVSPRHKAQLLHYLMLAELWHGMLINVRPEKMQRDFVNNQLSHHDRHQFQIVTKGLKHQMAGADAFLAILTDLIHDWGSCLDLGLYEEAISHFSGGVESVIRPASVLFDGQDIGSQNMRFVTDKTAFKLTAFESPASQIRFSSQLQRMANHLDIESLIWANISRSQVHIQSIIPNR